jgi:hypothetical protein
VWPSWFKDEDPNDTINIGWGQPGILAIVSIFWHELPYPPNTPRGTIILGIRFFSPLLRNEKKFVDELFRTGSVSHAFRVMSPVPYSQLALCTKLGNAPYRLDLFSLSKVLELD